MMSHMKYVEKKKTYSSTTMTMITMMTFKRAQLKCEKIRMQTAQDLQDNLSHYFATKLQCNIKCMISIHTEISPNEKMKPPP